MTKHLATLLPTKENHAQCDIKSVWIRYGQKYKKYVLNQSIDLLFIPLSIIVLRL